MLTLQNHLVALHFVLPIKNTTREMANVTDKVDPHNTMDHCIQRIRHVIGERQVLFQVMELAQGGSLLDYVRQRKRLAESEACFFLQQIVHGLVHCHEMEVTHCGQPAPTPKA